MSKNTNKWFFPKFLDSQKPKQLKTQLDLELWMGSQFKNIQVLTLQKFNQILDSCSEKLQFISLRSRHLDFKAVDQIMRRNYNELRILSLDFNNIGAYGCRLIALGQWNSLESLQIQQNNIGSRGVKYLMKMKCPRLQLLSLKSNHIDKEGVIACSKNKFRKLTTLYLQNNQTDFEALKHILISTTPSSRLYLTLYRGSKMTEEQLYKAFRVKSELNYIQVASY